MLNEKNKIDERGVFYNKSTMNAPRVLQCK